MFSTITKIVSEVLKVDSQMIDLLPEDTSLESLGLDSLKAMQLVISLEDEYGLQFDESELKITNFNTVSQIQVMLNKYSIIVK